MRLNPTDKPKYSDAAYTLTDQSRRSRLALLGDHELQREQIKRDVDDFINRGHTIDYLPAGVCRGLGKYEPENLTLNECLYG